MGGKDIKNVFLKIAEQNKEFSKRVSEEKFIDIVNGLNIIEDCYLEPSFQKYDNLLFRNLKIIESCPSLAIRTNSESIKKIYDVLKRHDELTLLSDGFSLLYANSENVDKILSYLRKQSYYSVLSKKVTLLTNGNYEDVVKISELFVSQFNEKELQEFFSSASLVLSRKFDVVKDIFNLLKQLNISSHKIIHCSSIFVRSDVERIKKVLYILEDLKKYFNTEANYNSYIEKNLGVIATSSPEHLLQIVNIISRYLECNPDIFSKIKLEDFIQECSSILSRGKADIVNDAFRTFKEYNKLELINHGKKPLIEERSKLCSMFDLFIEEGLERELTDHTSALYKKYDSLFARIYFLKKEGIYNPKDENTVKLIMSKDSYWKNSKYQKLQPHIEFLYSPKINRDKQHTILNNMYCYEIIREEASKNYPGYSSNEYIDEIIRFLDEQYRFSINAYLISNTLISRPKVIRNLHILNNRNVDTYSMLMSSILYNKIADEKTIKQIGMEIEKLNLLESEKAYI